MSEPTFEWDEAKDCSNQIKHGVSFETAQQAFSIHAESSWRISAMATASSVTSASDVWPTE